MSLSLLLVASSVRCEALRTLGYSERGEGNRESNRRHRIETPALGREQGRCLAQRCLHNRGGRIPQILCAEQQAESTTISQQGFHVVRGRKTNFDRDLVAGSSILAPRAFEKPTGEHFRLPNKSTRGWRSGRRYLSVVIWEGGD